MHFRRARAFYQQDRYEDAARECVQELAGNEDDAEARALLALCLQNMDKPREALHEARRAVGSDPENDFAHYALALVLREQGKPRHAERALLEALRLAPMEDPYHLLRGFCLHDMGRIGEALSEADRALSIQSENESAALLKAACLFSLHRKREAKEILRVHLSHQPDDATAHAAVGQFLLECRRPTEALVHFKKALRISPSDREIRQGLLDSLRSRYPFYRVLKSPREVILGTLAAAPLAIGLVAMRSPSLWKELTRPEGSPVLKTFLIGALALVLLLLWVRIPLYNFLLMLTALGRLTLHPWERAQAAWVGAAFSIAVVLGGLYAASLFWSYLLLSLMSAIVAGVLANDRNFRKAGHM